MTTALIVAVCLAAGGALGWWMGGRFADEIEKGDAP